MERIRRIEEESSSPLLPSDLLLVTSQTQLEGRDLGSLLSGPMHANLLDTEQEEKGGEHICWGEGRTSSTFAQ